MKKIRWLPIYVGIAILVYFALIINVIFESTKKDVQQQLDSIEYMAANFEEFNVAIAQKGHIASGDNTRDDATININNSEGVAFQFESRLYGYINKRVLYDGDTIDVRIGVGNNTIMVYINYVDRMKSNYCGYYREDYSPIPENIKEVDAHLDADFEISQYLPKEDLRELVDEYEAIKADLLEICEESRMEGD